MLLTSECIAGNPSVFPYQVPQRLLKKSKHTDTHTQNLEDDEGLIVLSQVLACGMNCSCPCSVVVKEHTGLLVARGLVDAEVA